VEGGEVDNSCCAPDVHEFVCQEVSVLVPSSSFSSRGEAWLPGKTRNVLVSAWSRLDSDKNIPGGWYLTHFFPCSEHRVGSIRVLDDGSDLWGRSSAFLWDACVLATSTLDFIFGVTVLASVFSSVYSSRHDISCWWLPGGFGTLAFLV